MGDFEPKAKLPVKQRLFVEHYQGDAAGNGTLAARLAGYQGDDNTLASTASKLLRSPKIRAILDGVSASAPHIATREERLRFLSEVMGDSTVAMRDRLKAVDLLSKVTGDYVQRVEVSGPDGGPVKSEAKLDVSGLDDVALETLIKATKG